MAPDSRNWRHQLGEAARGLSRLALKAVLPMCVLFVATSPSYLEARMEPARNSWSTLEADVVTAYEKPIYRGPVMLASLPPTSVFFNSSPAGRWSERIQIHSPKQPMVEQYICFYRGPGKVTFKDVLQRAWPYVPVIGDILLANGVPAEMAAVVFIESRFQGHASCRGAGGYWQMLAGTARSMGLRVDRWVDERRDPVKSTQAAAKYLRSFYDQYHSWPLALAAYNAGAGVVINALKRYGAGDFWELSQRRALPSRTLSYVPKVLAAVRILQDPEAHGFERPKNLPIYDFESIRIRSRTPLNLAQVARWVDVPVSTMRDLNPSLRMDCLPPDGGFELNLPSGARDRFDMAYADFLRR